uniref:Uncharacterized protein n=1 Tax=Eptatretus burgeri TaxID=7764 RepID=A0A8C4R3R0_EPTBU
MQGELGGTGPGEGSRSNEMTWWYRIAVRGVGVCAGISSAIAGLWNCITIYPLHLVSGIWMMLAIVPVIINPGLTSVLGNFITFATGVLYGLTILGKKGDGISYANIQHRQEITMMDVNNPSVP